MHSYVSSNGILFDFRMNVLEKSQYFRGRSMVNAFMQMPGMFKVVGSANPCGVPGRS